MNSDGPEKEPPGAVSGPVQAVPITVFRTYIATLSRQDVMGWMLVAIGAMLRQFIGRPFSGMTSNNRAKCNG